MSQEDILNCYIDLNRCAVSFYLNPQGQTHFVFLSHAIKIIKNKKYKKELLLIQKKLESKNYNNIEIPYMADQILTIGILLKQSCYNATI